MKLIYGCLVIIFLGFSSVLHAQYDLNLDFEKENSRGEPKNYFTEVKGYKIFLDSTVYMTGKKSLCIEYASSENSKHSELFTLLGGGLFRNKKCKLSGYIKTENVSDFAGFVIRVLGKDTVVANATMEKNGPKGNTGWTYYSVEAEVKNDCRQVWIGVQMGEKGKAWFDNLKFEIGGVEMKQPVLDDVTLNKDKIEWLDKNAFFFKSLNPNDNNNDLRFFKQVIDNAKIVSIGEGSYGTSEFVKMKHRIIKYLTEEMGFSLFIFSMEMTDAEMINTYIHSGKGNPKEILAGMENWYNDNQEFLDIIEWMRQYNLSGKGNVNIGGYEYDADKKQYAIIKEFLKKAEPEYLAKADSIYNEIERIKIEFKINTTLRPDPSYKPVLDKAVELFGHLNSKKEYYKTKYPLNEIEWVICCANNMIQMMQAYVPSATPRTQYISDNIEWVRNRYQEDVKFAFLSTNEIAAKSDSLRRGLTYLFSKKYNSPVVSIGMMFHSGFFTNRGKNQVGIYEAQSSPVGTVELMLHNYGKEYFAIDLRKASGSPMQNAFYSIADTRYTYPFDYKDMFYMNTAANNYDVLIYIDKSTPTKTFRNKK